MYVEFIQFIEQEHKHPEDLLENEYIFSEMVMLAEKWKEQEKKVYE